ncbi:RluA family pseudouridine synthase [Flavobacteriaceae bacterium]|nr:RluA family pseudouridine synthase [Flavobacteriaceae bacterium]MDC1167373.1 RluA family pseudouridine synthase [Flavobacteriaceae bacterium]
MLHFQHFKKDISGIEIPDKFTFPFYYEPNLLAKIAAKELQEYLEKQTEFKHEFGIKDSTAKNALGKMFGVLVVKNTDGDLGYLASFSGKLADESLPNKFVPPIFNMRTQGSFYEQGEKEIEKIGGKIQQLKKDKNYLLNKKLLKKHTEYVKKDLAIQRKKMRTSKHLRKHQKEEARLRLDDKRFEVFTKKLIQESFNDQFFYRELQEYYEDKIKKIKKSLLLFENTIEEHIRNRKKISKTIQNTLFEKYQFLNQQKEQKGLLDIFDNASARPPAGSGDCCAPKLLQYAFQHRLIPVVMAEFWWGISPNSAIRKHKNFYPSCQSRCKPILRHMLEGVQMDENLLLKNLSESVALKIVFEDDDLIIVNKPPEFLSVPGKEIKDSVYTRIKQKYPSVTGPIIVHRLDMSTSGILVLTKTKEANKILQQQFIKRTVKKKYVALLSGKVSEKKGTITLPLRLDLDDRPRQLVDFKNGKTAKTNWTIISENNTHTRIHFYPVTGRTHQLRVHAAHKDGLNLPIIGDDLYGTKQDRLYLHAEFIEFIHPTSKNKINFTVPSDF